MRSQAQIAAARKRKAGAASQAAPLLPVVHDCRRSVEETLMKKHLMVGIAVLVALLVGVSCAQSTSGNEASGASNEMVQPSGGDSSRPSIVVADQEITVDDPVGFILIASVVSDGPGWIVIQNDLYGRPGGIVGYAHVDSGESRNVMVRVGIDIATDHLIAELHRDRGRIGVFEYPPPIDAQARTGGRAVMQPFVITAEDTPLLNITALSRITPA